MTASNMPAASTAAASSGHTSRRPSRGAVTPTITPRMMMRSPFGVAKNLRIAQPVRFKALELGCDDQPVDADALEKFDPGDRPKNKRCRSQRVCKHRGGRHHR